jgi:hypothetical protein
MECFSGVLLLLRMLISVLYIVMHLPIMHTYTYRVR